MTKASLEQRQSIVDACIGLQNSGLLQGTSGNISLRTKDGILVTPSGIPYGQMTPDMICTIPFDGMPDLAASIRPTSEWRFHQSILAARPDLNAVVHAHTDYATALAVQRKPIPAMHYMVGTFGGTDIPIVDYALFGSDQLAQDAARAMAKRNGCLLANHGAIAAGESLAKAVWRLQELETLAKVYLLASSTGTPVLLDDAEMEAAIDAFKDYGLRDI